MQKENRRSRKLLLLGSILNFSQYHSLFYWTVIITLKKKERETNISCLNCSFSFKYCSRSDLFLQHSTWSTKGLLDMFAEKLRRESSYSLLTLHHLDIRMITELKKHNAEYYFVPITGELHQIQHKRYRDCVHKDMESNMWHRYENLQ